MPSHTATLLPWSKSARDLVRERDAERAARHAAFAERHGVRTHKPSSHNIKIIFRSAGASPEDVAAVYESVVKPGYGSQIWDHVEVWGKDGRPAIIALHPHPTDSESPWLSDRDQEKLSQV